MTNTRENVASALRALRGNWLRSALTMLGIVIGVGSVVLLVALGQGVKADVSRQIESLGANVVFIVPGKFDRSGQPNAMSTLGISTLTEQDICDLALLPGVTRAFPIMFIFGSVERGKEVYSAIVFASTQGMHEIHPQPLEEGRFFTDSEGDQRICVLANAPKKDIFGDAKAVGETILVRDVPFKVVGVLNEEEPSLFSQSGFANVIFLPFAASRSAFPGGQINRIVMETDYRSPPEPILDAAKATLIKNHGGKEDFGMLTQKQLLGTVFRVFNLLTALLVGISAISLVVAGIGIMNIMLVTVTERTREIGLRKAVGSRRRDVFAQFLTEAVLLSFVGGLVGTLLAAGICAIVARVSPLKPLITLNAVGLAFVVCSAVGILFGVAPALRAARQDPIEALRWE